ncbi:MAG: GIY-YIG nuclease family protein [Deferribacterales bacterium]
MRNGYVYIITNSNNSTLYVGVTSNIKKRIYEHKQKFIDGFSKKYNLTKLVYFECFDNITDALCREKQLKAYKRAKKQEIVNSLNPEWKDLYEGIL